MANVKNNASSQETQRRLLQAAGEVFAERGFHEATIKEITDRAGASLASVNYHFSDKAELYQAVLRRMGEDACVIIPPDSELTGDAATRFRQFVRWYCVNLLGRERAHWEQALIVRELAQPSEALGQLLDEVFRPLNEKLSTLIAELLDVPRGSIQVTLVAASVFGQCLYYLKHQRILGRMHPELGDSPDVERLAAHIAEFSLAGMRGVAKACAAKKK